MKKRMISTLLALALLSALPAAALAAETAEGPAPAPLPFTDVAQDAWYYDAVTLVYTEGLMTGTSAATFSPDDNATRQQLWLVIRRIIELPYEEEPMTLQEARTWAAEAGYTDGTAPAAPLTRQQLAVTLFRLAVDHFFLNAVTLEENLTGFSDGSQVSEYAVSAMNWAVGQDILTDAGGGLLAPHRPVTRAELAATLDAFYVRMNMELWKTHSQPGE